MVVQGIHGVVVAARVGLDEGNAAVAQSLEVCLDLQPRPATAVPLVDDARKQGLDLRLGPQHDRNDQEALRVWGSWWAAACLVCAVDGLGRLWVGRGEQP